MSIELPKIKKKITSFLTGEEGKISKRAGIGIGIALAGLALQFREVYSTGQTTSGCNSTTTTSCGTTTTTSPCNSTTGDGTTTTSTTATTATTGGTTSGHSSVTTIDYTKPTLTGSHSSS